MASIVMLRRVAMMTADDDDDDFVSARYSNIRIMMSVVYYKQRSVTPAHSSAAILGPQTTS